MAVCCTPFVSSANAIRLESMQRMIFERMEPEAGFVVNLSGAELKALGKGGVQIEVTGLESLHFQADDLKISDQQLRIPVNTSLRNDAYTYRITLLDEQGGSIAHSEDLEVIITPRPVPYQMPVVLWSGIAGALDRIKDIGFTHVFAIWESRNTPAVEFLNEKQIEDIHSVLNELMKRGLYGMAKLNPEASTGMLEKYARVDSEGNPAERASINGLVPEVQQYFAETGSFVKRHFGDHPAFQAALLSSEVRDRSHLSYSPVDEQAWREYSGDRPIPPEVSVRSGVLYNDIDGFPASRVIADDDPILEYYRWFWKEGDGWNQLHTLTSDAIKPEGRDDFWTWFDPAVRAPSLYGSGGDVDVIAQWSYVNPDPLKISLHADELIAMARGREGQEVMSMTQIIWRRWEVVPKNTRGIKPAQWELDVPDHRYITIAPDHLTEALWMKLSHPIKGIMYHGYPSLVRSNNSYAMTNPETRERLRDQLNTVVKPLGPTLLQVPDKQADVAFLQSFASEMFARRANYAYGRGWRNDAYLITRYAGLQPDVLYDETVLEEGLDPYNVLIATHCDVLTESVASAIIEFQKLGGIVVGDEFLAPAIQPDILLESFRRGERADRNKQILLDKADQLRKELADFYEFPYETDNPDIILRARDYQGSTYLFAINDHRDFGDYLGHYGMVQEKGLPVSGRIRFAREEDVFVYDLRQQRQVLAQQDDFGLVFTSDLPAGEGTVYLILDVEVGELGVTGPESVSRGESAEIDIKLVDGNGDGLPAVVPLEIRISDPEGRSAERSGFYGAADGQQQIILDIASNDLPGDWLVEVTEGLTGQIVQYHFAVK